MIKREMGLVRVIYREIQRERKKVRKGETLRENIGLV